MFWELNEVPKWPLTSSKLLSIPSVDSPFRSKMLPGGPWSAQASSAHRALVSLVGRMSPLANMLAWISRTPPSPGCGERSCIAATEIFYFPLSHHNPKKHSGQQEVWISKKWGPSQVRRVSWNTLTKQYPHSAPSWVSCGQLWPAVARCGQMWSAA